MNKHLSKGLLLFLACFVGQANPVWISQPEFVRQLGLRGLSYGRATHREASCFDTASHVWVHYQSWRPWETNIPTVAKFLAFLEGADSYYATIATNPALQAKRISVLKDFQEVLLQIFFLILQNEKIDPIENVDEIESFDAGFAIDHDLFRDLGRYFNEFVHEIEALQDASHREIIKQDIYKAYLNNFVRKMIARLRERFDQSNDQTKEAIQDMRNQLKQALQNYDHDLKLLNKLEVEFKDQENSTNLPYRFNQHVKELGTPQITWKIFASSRCNVGDLRLQKRQFAVVVDFLNSFESQLDCLFPHFQELFISGFARLTGRSAVLNEISPTLFIDGTGLGDLTGEDLYEQNKKSEERKQIMSARRANIKSLKS